MREGMPARRYFERIAIRHRCRGRQVGLRDAVLPCESVLIPKRPEKSEHQRRPGKQISEASPQKLPSVRKRAIEADDRQASQLHAGSRPRKSGKQEKVLCIEQEKSRRKDDGINFLKHQLSPE